MSFFLNRFHRALLAIVLLSLAGCAVGRDDQEPLIKKNGELPPIPAPRQAIQLEVVFIDRPKNDPLLGSLLWSEVDQIGALEPELRAKLEANGFRIGQVGSRPPTALQTLLGLTTEISNGAAGDQRRLSGRRIVVQSGGEAEIPTRDQFYPHCTMTVAQSEDESVREFDNMNCVFRVNATRLQDGWGNLEFLPEVHHAAKNLRPTATNAGWQFQTRQKVEPLFGQRFSISLTLGEMAVITADSQQVDSAGYRFFIGADADAPNQRVLVLRLSDMKKVDPVYAE